MTTYPITVALCLASGLGLGIIAAGAAARRRGVDAKTAARWIQPVGCVILAACGVAEFVTAGVAGFAIWAAAIGPIGWGVANVMSRSPDGTPP